MPLSPGTRLGNYEVLEPIANGASTETYKASDTEQQSRVMSLRILPPGFSEAGKSRSQIEKAVKSLASVTHPNICSPYQIGKEGETDFLVTEFFDGETLAKRLERGPLPLDEAMKLALEMADALNKAHRAGVMHLSLRPANILLTPTGVKLADFGLPALEERPDGDTSSAIPDDVLRYMAPEQINGAAHDARSDIFAFGAVLYEMVTGAKAFEGKNQPVLIAAITTLDPDPLSKTQPDVPAALDHVAERCLAKKPDDRWQTSHDLLVQLRWVAEGGEMLLAAARARRKREKRLLAIIVLVVFGVSLALTKGIAALNTHELSEVLQFRVPVAGLSPSDISISPDGKMLALVAKPNTQESAWLFVRQVNSPEFQRLTGTQDASQPFWSPDSQSIGFVAGGRLKRVAVTGGAPKDLGEAKDFMGGTWGVSQVILFGTPKGVFRVSAEGGKAEAVTKLADKETGHFWPSFLPDGNHFVYLTWSADTGSRSISSASINSPGAPARLMAADSNAQYAAPGYLLFRREATLFAQPFDAGKIALLSGDPLHIADQLDFNPNNGRGNFAVSQAGAVVYFQGQGGTGGQSARGQTNGNFQWAWVDRTGHQTSLAGETKVYGDMDLSPNEKLIAVTQSETANAAADIWIIEWQQEGRSYRLTRDPGDNYNPVWERPSGDRVAYTTYRKGNADIYVKNANGTGPETPLLDTPVNESIEAWSNDGKYIAYKRGPDGSEDLWAMPLFGDKKPFPVVVGPFHKDEPQFSYDGKWLAFTSDESAGVYQVYIVSFPDPTQHQIRVSKDGGGQPRWRADGKELFFRSENDNLAMAVDITLVDGKVQAGVPRKLFPAPQQGTVTRTPNRHQWSVTKDGQRFLMRTNATQTAGQGGVTVQGVPATFQGPTGTTQSVTSAQSQVLSGLTVIRNWMASFRKAAP